MSVNIPIIFLPLVIAWLICASNKRRRFMKAWAKQHGFKMDGINVGSYVIKKYKLFSMPGMKLTCRGTWKRRTATVADLVIRSPGSDGGSSLHMIAALELGAPQDVPRINIRPEDSTVDRLEAFLGENDIDFESVEFSDRYYVKSEDPRWAYNVLNPQIIQLLLDAKEDYTIEIKNRHVFLIGDHTWDEAEIEARLNLLATLIERIPEWSYELAEEAKT